MSFPTDEALAGCGDWCRPLHMVETAIAGQDFAKYFRVDDFMCMGKLHRGRRPDLILNKHGHTRLYLNLDPGGHAYRYLPPPPGSSSRGQYRAYSDLVEAIDHLRLYELPWLVGSGFDDQRLGLDWSERWDHPDAVAWFERQERRSRRRRVR